MKYFLVLYLFLIIYSPAISQTGSVNGYIFDKETGLKIQSGDVFIENTQFNTQSDEEGYYKINDIPAGNYFLIFSYAGYKIIKQEIKIKSGTTAVLNIELPVSNITTGEIIVTSQRYKSQIKDVPLPIEVVEKDEILKSPSNTISELLGGKPGLSLTRDGIWATDITIRGMSKNNIVTLIDGNRIETATDLSARLSMFDLNDIERVEVIKGGASSLYGTGALGGIINVVTKSSFFSSKKLFSGSLTSGFNSVNENAFGSLKFNFSSPIFYASISGLLNDARNTKTPNGILNNSQYKNNYQSANIGFKPSVEQELKFNYQRYYASDVGLPGGNLLFPTNAVVTYPTEKREFYNAEYTISNFFKPLKRFNIKYYYQTVFRDVLNIPNQVVLKKAVNGNLIQKTSLDKITPKGNHYTNGIQLQTDWIIGKNNNLIAGLDLWQRNFSGSREKYQTIQKYDSITGNLISTTNKITGEQPIPESNYRSIGAFAQDELRFMNNNLKITFGGRIDRIKVTNSLTLNPLYEITNGIYNSTPTGQKIIWNQTEQSDISWSGNIGILYKLVPDIDITFNTSRSFRSPSLEERFQYIDLGSYLRIGNPALNPEQGFSADLGLRIWKDVFHFSGNIFINTFTDLVAEVQGTYEGRPAFVKTNIGKARYYGFEFDFIYNFYKQFLFYGNLSYVRGQDTENNFDLPAIPPLNGRLGLKADLFNYVTLDLSSTIFDRQDKVAAGEISTPGYAVFNLNVSSIPLNYSGIKFQFISGIENIINKAYRNHLATNRGSITSEPGRNFYFKVNMNW